MSEKIERPPRRDLNETSKRILLFLADKWLSSPLCAARCWNTHELIEAGLVATDDDGDHKPTDLGIRYSRAWLDLDGFQQRTRANVLSLVARGPVPSSELEGQPSALGFAFRWLLRSGELARLFSAGEGPLYGLPETGGDPTQSPGWSRLVAGSGIQYAPALNGLLSTGMAYKANWEKDRLVRLTTRGARRSLWERPGGRLLQKILPAWRATAPEGVIDDFLGRRLGPVTATLEAWITEDARRSSEAAIPDIRLVEALLSAAAGDWEYLVSLARLTLSDYWAMDALRGRGAEAHTDGAALVIDALVTARARFGGGDMETMRAIKGTPPSRWRPPVYRRAS